MYYVYVRMCTVCTVCTVCAVCTVCTVCAVCTVCTVCAVCTVCTVCTVLLPSSLVMLIASVANYSPIEVTHAVRRVKFHLLPQAIIFNSNCSSISRLKNTSIANSDLDMHAL